MMIEVSEEAADAAVFETLCRQRDDIIGSGSSDLQSKRVLAALAIVIAWNCTFEEAKRLGIEWEI